MAQHLVVALAYDGLCTFEFGCVVELFALPRPELKVDWYRFAVCASEKGFIRAAGGIGVQVPYSLNMLDRADTIVVPGWSHVDHVPSPAIVKKIRAAHERGARICSICSGVFVLAEAGILDGKSATTHWRYASTLAARYPRIDVNPNALYVDEGRILTSAGSAAGLDMLLHLVRTDYGSRIANRVAQRLVVPPHREGGQAQFVPRPLLSDESGRLTKLMDWVRQHPAQRHSLESLAGRVAMSPRTLQRQFLDSTGMSPYEWLIRERISVVKELLESSAHGLGRVAELAGIGSEESLRKHFKRVVGTSPSAYRRQFSAVAESAGK